MTYGTERFVGGGMSGAAIKIFDFRWTKGYYHTSGLPCLGKKPFSPPSQPFVISPLRNNQMLATWNKYRCDHINGHLCRWHELSRDIYYRPNATFFLGHGFVRYFRHNNAVWSLAKSSDAAPNFYIGISGGIVESNLGTLEPTKTPLEAWEHTGGFTEAMKDTHSDPPFTREENPGGAADPTLGYENWRDINLVGPRYQSMPYESSYTSRSPLKEKPLGYPLDPYETFAFDPWMMETGDGRAVRRNDTAIEMPRIWREADKVLKAVERKNQDVHHRLDMRFREHGNMISNRRR